MTTETNFNREFLSFINTVNNCQTLEDLELRHKSLDRLYGAGIFTPEQLAALDVKLLDRQNELLEEGEL